MHRFLRLETTTLFAVGLILVVAVATYAGWHLMLFMTDDAHIEFRYVSNWIAGRGLVWNPPPFAPVEGYTSFAWCILLGIVWRLTGVAPPESSPWLSLAFGYVTLYFGARLLLRLVPRGSLHRLVLLALVYVATLTNRTFLAWLSSGLETSMFNCCITWWLVEATTEKSGRDTAWVLRLSLGTALLTLTRPDGLLFLVFTLAGVALHLRQSGAGIRAFAAASILLVPIAHLVWRRAFYGLWLPTTYFAKSDSWPAAGVRYASSFALEYAYWLPPAIAIILWWKCRRDRSALHPGTRRPHDRWLEARRRGPWNLDAAQFGAIALLILHAGYYVLIGGDHFEYRVFSHLPLLIAVVMAWMAHRWSGNRGVSCGLMGGFILLSWPIGWVHWYATRNLTEYSLKIVQPIAPLFPAVLRPIVGVWDREQAWLISHVICCRRIEHKLFFEHQVGMYPTREEGGKVSWEGRPVHASRTVGLLGWVVPNIAIIDYLGLNDRVVSRHKTNRQPGAIREIAHDRVPPVGYVDCFQPNVGFEDRKVYVMPRREPLRDRQIVECERREWSRVASDLAYEAIRFRQREIEFDRWRQVSRDSSANPTRDR